MSTKNSKNADPLKVLKKINPLALISFVATLVFLVAAGLFIHSGFTKWYEQYTRDHLRESAQWVSQEISVTLERQQQSLQEVSASEVVQQAFLSSTEDRTAAISFIKNSIPRAQSVRMLFPSELADLEVDPSDRGYAALDMLLQAKEKTQAPPAELHWFGTQNERINLVEPVILNDELIGLLEVTMPSRVLTRLFEDLSISGGYVSLLQRTPTRGGSVDGLHAGNPGLRKMTTRLP